MVQADWFTYERVEIKAVMVGLFWRETWQKCHLSGLHCSGLYSTLALGGRVHKFGLYCCLGLPRLWRSPVLSKYSRFTVLCVDSVPVESSVVSLLSIH